MNQELSLTQQELQKQAKRVIRIAWWQVLSVATVLMMLIHIGLDSAFKLQGSTWTEILTAILNSLIIGPSMVFAGFFAHYRVKNSPYYQGQPVRRFITRTATTTDRPTQEFRAHQQRGLFFGGSVFFVLLAAVCQWQWRAAQPAHDTDYLLLFGVFMCGALGLLSFATALRSLFPTPPVLRITPTGIEGQLLQKGQHQIVWSEISGCQIVEMRNYLGNPTYYELLFQDENGRLISRVSLCDVLTLSEQRRLVQTLERFLQSPDDSA